LATNPERTEHQRSSLEVCLDRQDNSLARAPFAIADRCAATFAYWGNYERHACDVARAQYWMERYYGFIAADQ
jgi:hypothetical protein